MLSLSRILSITGLLPQELKCAIKHKDIISKLEFGLILMRQLDRISLQSIIDSLPLTKIGFIYAQDIYQLRS